MIADPSVTGFASAGFQATQPQVTPPLPVGQTNYPQDQYLQQQSAPQQVLLPQSPNYQQIQSPAYAPQAPYQPQPVVQPTAYPTQTVYFQPQPVIIGPSQPMAINTESQSLIKNKRYHDDSDDEDSKCAEGCCECIGACLCCLCIALCCSDPGRPSSPPPHHRHGPPPFGPGPHPPPRRR